MTKPPRSTLAWAPVVLVLVAALAYLLFTSDITGISRRLANVQVGLPTLPTKASQMTDLGYSVQGNFIVGKARNDSGSKLGYVAVEFNCYDSTGAMVESSIANAANLEPGETWSYRAPLASETVSRAQLKAFVVP